MASKKVLLVFGATGKQGGSVVKSILADSNASELFRICGVTRDTSKPAAQALEAKGVETVAASLDDAESLKKAMQGAYAVYAMTNYWESLDEKKEYQQGVNVVDAAKESGVQHLIISTLKNVTKLTDGKFPHVYHFDSKAKIADYAREVGVPMTEFMPGFYMDNLVSNIRKGEDGHWGYYAPYSKSTPIPLFDTDKDTGLFVKAILLNREKTLGRAVLGATDYYTPTQIVESFAKAKPEAGKGLTFTQVPADVFKGNLAKAGMPDFVQEELLENMMFMEPYGYYGGEKLDFSHSLLDKPPTTFEEFVRSAPAWSEVN
jgi:uncharacterized protein YbjT (DUF2867 family)